MSNQLSAHELRSFFDQDVVPYLEDLRSQAQGGGSWPPVLVYTGGQPGAGKSRANERAAKARPSLVPVIGDDLRQFHPDYARLMREDPLAMPRATAQASGQWIGMAANYLREQRADVLIETTLRSLDAMTSTISSFREAGYVVELRVVAVSHEVSRLATIERFTAQVEATGAGRWTPAFAHDEAFERAPETVRALIAAGSVDRFVIEDRSGQGLFDKSYFGVRDEGLLSAGQDAAKVFTQARDVDRLTLEAAIDWLRLARDQIDCVGKLRRQDPDLLSTIERIGTMDARTVAARAYPQEPARASMAALMLSAAARETVHRSGLHAETRVTTHLPQQGFQPYYREPSSMSDRSSGLEPGV